ncbi:MAG: TonB-dependent receptor [Rhodospirillaceae bacterium]|nr:TonB-dependent receptor [Rhodospirillaceae bacterium]
MKQNRKSIHRVGNHVGLMVACGLLAGVGTMSSSAVLNAALAQDPQAASADDIPEIVVTGSRIARKDADSVGPIFTLTEEDVRASGANSIGELLQKLPAAGVSLNTNGTQGTSYGASSINLRYLGGAEGSGNRVLVLVDGHRWVDGGGQRGFRDFVDLNTMPLGMIEGIEVLKDGASAIYGADAIAGVVNIQTIRDFEGVRVSGKTGITSEGDGEQYSGTVSWGQRFTNSALVLTASYVNDKPIRTDARDLTTLTLVPQTAVGNNPNGLYILPGLANNAFFGTPAGWGTSASPIVANGLTNYGSGALADDSFHIASLPRDFYNLQAQGIHLVGPSERYGVYGRYTIDLSDTVTSKTEALFNKRKSDQLFSPVLLDIGGTSGNITGFSLPNNHPFNPFGTANGVPTANAVGFAANQAWRIRRVMGDVGNRNNVQDVETYRIAQTFEGEFELFENDWKWDLFGSYAKNETSTRGENGINYEAMLLGLGPTANCTASPGCVPINLFAPMTAQMANYVRYNASEYNETEIYDVTFDVTGDLIELPAGMLAVAAGYEYRTNKADDLPDVFVNAVARGLPATATTTTHQTRTPTKGKYNLHEAYMELAVPVLKDAPMAESLDLSLAARYSDYNTVGDATTLKAGAGWRPVEDLLFRGTYAQGFRAPSILELFQGRRETSFAGVDPCNGGQAANPTLPGCAGIPANYNQNAFNLNGLIPGTIAGNLNLEPETSDSYSLGMAIQPSAIEGLAVTVDWFDIKIKDAIGAPTSTQILQLCARFAGAFCDLVTRDPATGAVRNLLQGAQNLNEISTSGVDFTIRYDFDTTIGDFAAVADASYLDKFRTVSPNPAGGAPIVDDRAGRGDAPRSTYPRWKGQASLRWNDVNDTWGAVWRARYIGPTTDIANAVKDSRTDSRIYNDIEATYNFSVNEASVTLGVNNVFNVQPPASYANAPINFDMYTYDPRGTSFYLRVGAAF